MLIPNRDPADPTVQQMVQAVSQDPSKSVQYGVSLAEIFALKNLISRLQQPPQQPPQTTVAQDLAAQAQQLVAAREQGVAGLPVAGFQPQNFNSGIVAAADAEPETQQLAGGGIVAFRSGGDIFDEPKYAMSPAAGPYGPPPEDMSYDAMVRREQEELEARRARLMGEVPTQAQAVQQVRDMQEAAGIKGLLGADRVAELNTQLAQAPDRMNRATADSLADFGFRLAAHATRPGASFLASASRAAPGAMENFVKARRELEILDEARKKELAAIDTARRAEMLGVVRDASGIVKTHEDRLAKVEDKMDTLRGRRADTQAQREKGREDNAARAEQERLRRDNDVKIARLQAAAQQTLERMRQEGSFDYNAISDYNKALKLPEDERAVALEQWRVKYADIGKARAKASGVGGAATGLAQAVRLYISEAKAIDDDYKLLPAEKQTKKEALRREYGVTAEDITAYRQSVAPNTARSSGAQKGGGVDPNNPLLK